MTNGGNCSFCGKSASEVFRLISGPSCMICSECIGRSANMIARELQETAETILSLSPPKSGSGT